MHGMVRWGRVWGEDYATCGVVGVHDLQVRDALQGDPVDRIEGKGFYSYILTKILDYAD